MEGKQMTEELKPCPFCGGNRFEPFHNGEHAHYFICECTAESPYKNSKEEAIKAHNTRPVEDALRERVKRLEEALRSAESFIKRRAGGGETDFREGLLKALEEKHG